MRGAGLELSVLGSPVDDAEGAGWDAEATPVADVLLDVDRAVFGANQRPGWAGLQARGVGAVLADVGHHQPALLLPVAVGFRLLDELDVAPGGGPQTAGVVVAVAGHRKAVGGQLVPLLAGHFAGLAADAEAGVGEESLRRFGRGGFLDVHQPFVGVDHRNRPLRTSQVSALSSWM